MAQERSLEGRAAMVTGASRGIGRATAERLAAGGADIALVSRSEETLTAVTREIEADHGVSAIVLPTDVRDADAVRNAVDTTIDAFGGLDVLVNNAGLTTPGPEERFEEIPLAEYEPLVETNVTGMLYATYAALPALRAAQGNLVFVGSSAGKFPRPGAPLYAGTKWWTRGFALSIQGDAGRDGVAVTLVNPTAVRTDLWPDLEPGEAAEPQEVAAVVAFAAQQAPHTTLSEVDLFRRDLLGAFLPRDVDTGLAFEPE